MGTDEILDFITRRFSVDENWCSGNCYWLAYILTTRFNNLKIYYLPIANHFIAGDGELFYDWNGKHLLSWYDEPPHEWAYYKDEEPIEYKRIVRDCIL